jgi:DNA-binding MarR family transcriptional regulator
VKAEFKPSDKPHYRALLEVLRTGDVLWNASREFFERWGLTSAQFNVLNILMDAEGGLSQSQLSRQLLTHRSNLTGMIQRLVEKGWVRRSAREDDGRAWEVTLTEGGTNLMVEIRPRYYEAVFRVTEGLTDTEALMLCRVLKGLAERAGRLHEKTGLEREGL